MNKIAIIALSALLIFGGYIYMSQGSVEYDVQEVESTAISEKIDVVEFEEKYLTGDYIVIDVRTPEEYAEGRLVPDAKLINFYDNDFEEQLSLLNKNQKYLVHCRSGSRSGRTLPIMRELGFTEVYDLTGGKNAWVESGRALVQEANNEMEADTNSERPPATQPTMCPMDAKICPDGTAVGREGPNCEFRSCS